MGECFPESGPYDCGDFAMKYHFPIVCVGAFSSFLGVLAQGVIIKNKYKTESKEGEKKKTSTFKILILLLCFHTALLFCSIFQIIRTFTGIPHPIILLFRGLR